MKSARYFFLFVGICSILVAGYLLYQKKDAGALLGLLTVIGSIKGYFMFKDKNAGKGGSAITVEEGSNLILKNSGTVAAGKGGTGGPGGDAIRINSGPDVTVKIVNNKGAFILGGDAEQV